MANSIQIKKLKLGIWETEKTALLALLCKWTNLNKIFLSKSFDGKESEREKEKEMRATDVSANRQTNRQTNKQTENGSETTKKESIDWVFDSAATVRLVVGNQM